MIKQIKKVLILLIVVVLVSGCSAEVNVDIGYDSIDETVSINVNNNEMNGTFRQYMSAYYDELPGDEEKDVEVDGVEYYEYSKTNTTSGTNIRYHYKFPFMKYKNSTSINSMFTSSLFGVSEEDNAISITINDGLTRDGKIKPVVLFDKYTDLTEIRINVRSKIPVLYSNADIQENGVYTWIFNSINHDKTMELILDRGDLDIHQETTTKRLRIKDVTTTTTVPVIEDVKGISNVSKVMIWIWVGILGLVLLFVIGSFIKKQIS